MYPLARGSAPVFVLLVGGVSVALQAVGVVLVAAACCSCADVAFRQQFGVQHVVLVVMVFCHGGQRRYGLAEKISAASADAVLRRDTLLYSWVLNTPLRDVFHDGDPGEKRL